MKKDKSKIGWWGILDSNQGPRHYECPALTAELMPHLQTAYFGLKTYSRKPFNLRLREG